MMTHSISEQNSFQLALANGFLEMDKSGALERVREKGWDHFLELGLPSRQNDVFRYVKLRHFYSQSFVSAESATVTASEIAPYIYPECLKSHLVFVNGYYRPDLSQTTDLPGKIVLMPLSDAMKTYGALLQNQWAKSIKEESDPFAALNLAMHNDALFLYVPPQVQCPVPLQILYVSSCGGQKMFIQPRVQIFMGANAELRLLSTHATLSGYGHAINQVTEVTLGDNARLHYTQNNCHQANEVWHFDALRAILKRDSALKTISLSNGCDTVRNDYRVQLTAENGEALLNGIWMLNEKREAHHHILIDHQAPSCRSMQLFKGALSDLSHSSFEGKILVRQAAQQTAAFQLNNNLLLSNGALAESKPNLEIFADDVKASHGATVGQLDKEALFYLLTRGFSAAEAKNLLVSSFCKEVIDMIEIPSLRQELIRRVSS